METANRDYKEMGKAIYARVIEIVTKPSTCWPALKEEERSIEDLYLGYIVPLAAIGPICAFISGGLFGTGSFFGAIYNTILRYAVCLVMIYVNALVIEKVATFMGGSIRRQDALKLLAYAGTPSLVAGILMLIPPLWLIGGLIAAGYSVYLFVIGAPQMANVPEEKKIGFIVGSILAMIAVGIVIAIIQGILSCGHGEL